MIQSGTYLNIIDNSGTKIAACIKVMAGYRRRYAYTGDTVMVSVKELRSKRRASSKTKKGEMYKALVVRTLKTRKNSFGDSLNFLENSAILLTKQNKLVGTRIFGAIPKSFRYTKFLKIVSLSSGLLS
jgi:large subunit ribosomal protein L14